MHYVNLRQKNGEYFGMWNLPEEFGLGHLGKGLDDCASLIRYYSRKGKAETIQLKSHIDASDRRAGHGNVPIEDLKLLVLCLNEKSEGEIIYELAPNPVLSSMF